MRTFFIVCGLIIWTCFVASSFLRLGYMYGSDDCDDCGPCVCEECVSN
jgi:hypothetical protein